MTIDMKFEGINGEHLSLDQLGEHTRGDHNDVSEESASQNLTILWVMNTPVRIEVDHVEYEVKPHHIVCYTYFHHVRILEGSEVRRIHFNKEFYCVQNHDSEVSCRGILYFGAQELPIVSIPTEERENFELVWRVFSMEMKSNDHLRLEMLQMMLKRTLILITRLYSSQHGHANLPLPKQGLMREFLFLVEQHFRTKHSVAEYATLMHKSPKTISNLFHSLGERTPLQLIQDRITLEAKRLLTHSQSSIKQIAFEIGFDEATSFSRFFKKQVGLSPASYRESILSKK